MDHDHTSSDNQGRNSPMKLTRMPRLRSVPAFALEVADAGGTLGGGTWRTPAANWISALDALLVFTRHKGRGFVVALFFRHFKGPFFAALPFALDQQYLA